jgi:hypothetical protein
MKTKSRESLSMRDRLSHLSFADAVKLLGSGTQGKALLIAGGAYELAGPQDLVITDKHARMTVLRGDVKQTSVSIVFESTKAGKLRLQCDRCPVACEHGGALLSTVLESKSMA